MAKKKSGSKLKKALLTLLGVILVIAAVVFAGARIYFRLPVKNYYKASEKAFVIPGLMDNMVPQGFDYVERSDLYLIGGYQKDGSPSRVYRVYRQDGKSNGYVVLGDEEGNGIAPHAGGLAAHGEYLFVAGDEDPFVYVFDLMEVLSAKSGATVKTLGKFDTAFGGDTIRADFMCFTKDRFIVGEFYRDPNYTTPDSHVVKTSSGGENRAFALCYPLSDGEDSNFGIDRYPTEAYSLPDMVQGITVNDGKIWLSQSYAVSKSTISCYDISGAEPSDVRILKLYSGVAGKDRFMEVYVLDESTEVASFSAPPMAEEIIFVDGKLLTMSESASMKYFFGNLTGGRWCYATDVSKVS